MMEFDSVSKCVHFLSTTPNFSEFVNYISTSIAFLDVTQVNPSMERFETLFSEIWKLLQTKWISHYCAMTTDAKNIKNMLHGMMAGVPIRWRVSCLMRNGKEIKSEMNELWIELLKEHVFDLFVVENITGKGKEVGGHCRLEAYFSGLVNGSVAAASEAISFLLSVPDRVVNQVKGNEAHFTHRSMVQNIFMAALEFFDIQRRISIKRTIEVTEIFVMVLSKFIRQGHSDSVSEVLLGLLNYNFASGESSLCDDLRSAFGRLPAMVIQFLFFDLLLRYNHHYKSLCKELQSQMVSFLLGPFLVSKNYAILKRFFLHLIWTQKNVPPFLSHKILNSFVDLDPQGKYGLVTEYLVDSAQMWRDESFLRNSTLTQHRQIAFGMLSMLSILDTLMKSNTTESHIIDWVKYSSSSTVEPSEEAPILLPNIEDENQDPNVESKNQESNVSVASEITTSQLYNVLSSSGALGPLLEGITLRLSSSLASHRQLAQHMAHILSKVLTVENDVIHFPLSEIQAKFYTAEFSQREVELDPLYSFIYNGKDFCSVVIVNELDKVSDYFYSWSSQQCFGSENVPSPCETVKEVTSAVQTIIEPENSRRVIIEESDESDDDLVPLHDIAAMDINLESKVTTVYPPVYLQDLLNYLQSSPNNSNKDKEDSISNHNLPLLRLESGLKHAAILILKQPSDLSDFCEILCDTLLSLHDSYSVDNFQQFKDEALVALIVTKPQMTINCLLTRMRKDSLNLHERLLVLDVIISAASRLSMQNLTPVPSTIASSTGYIPVLSENNNKNDQLWGHLKVTKNEIKNAHESRWKTIDERLATKTRIFAPISSSKLRNKTGNNTVPDSSLRSTSFAKIAASDFFFPLVKLFIGASIESFPIYRSSFNQDDNKINYSSKSPWWSKNERSWMEDTGLHSIINEKCTDSTFLSRWIICLVHIATCAGEYCLDLVNMFHSILPIMYALSSHPHAAVRRSNVISCWRFLSLLSPSVWSQELSKAELENAAKWLSRSLDEFETDEQVRDLSRATLLVVNEVIDEVIRGDMLKSTNANNILSIYK